MSKDSNTDEGMPAVRRRISLLVALTALGGFLTLRLNRKRHSRNETPHIKRRRRRNTMSAERIAETLYETGLEGEELYAAMWDWHDRTGIETRDIYTHYKTLHTPA